MGRSESKQVSDQGRTQSAEDQAHANDALAATNQSLNTYKRGLNSFMTFGRKAFSPTGEYMRDQNTIANTTAAAGTTGLKANLALNAMRTGENTSGYAGTVAESAREGRRDLTDQLAKADANRLAQLTAIEQYGVEGSKLPATVQAGLYGNSLGASASQLGPAASAAQQPGFWDQFAPALVGGAAGVAKGFTPHG
jgi:hypothetical protein